MTVCRQCGSANEAGVSACFKCGAALIAAHMVGKIACQVHANREATTSCTSCGARLCDACAYNLNGIDYCEACAPEGAIASEHDEDYERIPVLQAAGAERASFFSRAFAAVVDLGVMAAMAALVGLLYFALSKWTWIFLNPRLPGFYFYSFSVLLVCLAYPAIATAMDGRTLGKYAAGVIVLQADGTIVPLPSSVVRTLSAVLSALPLGLGFLWALWDENGETWHDKISGTYAFRYQDPT